MRVTMGQTISQSTVILEHYLPGSSPTRHFDRREDPGDEVESRQTNSWWCIVGKIEIADSAMRMSLASFVIVDNFTASSQKS